MLYSFLQADNLIHGITKHKALKITTVIFPHFIWFPCKSEN